MKYELQTRRQLTPRYKRGEGEIDQRINYTHENPVRAIIVADPHEYLFSSARDYAGEK